MRSIETKITSELEGRTVRSVLQNNLYISGTAIKRIRDIGGIRINGKEVKTTDRVVAGTILTVDIAQDSIYGRKPPFSILYEDEDTLIVDKPGGMLTHGTKQLHEEYTVAMHIREYLPNNGFHPVNRLDRGTSGVMVLAKNAYMHTRLIESLHTENFYRTYIAIVQDEVASNNGIIDLPIGRDDISPIKRVISQSGKSAVTKYSVIARGDGASLVKIRPVTGRTHQIRLHFSAIGNPIIGDFLYGSETEMIRRYALHSYSVQLMHPLTGDKICVRAALPKDMEKLVHQLIGSIDLSEC